MTNQLLLLIAITAFSSVTLLILSLGGVIYRKTNYAESRLQTYLTSTAMRKRLKNHTKKQRKIPFSDAFDNLMSKKGKSKRLEDDLLKANIPLKVGEFLVLWAVFVVITTVAFSLIFDLLLGLAGFAISFLLPDLWIKIKKKNRINAFNNHLTDTLLTIANSLKAGYSFFQALELIAEQGQSPIKEEFGRMLKEVNMGLNLEEAFGHLLQRVESEDLELVVTAVLIQRQIGGNLSEILEKISTTIRERVRLQGEIKVLTAQGRLSGWIVSLLPVAIALFIQATNPDYLSVLFREPLGLALIGAGIVSQLLGIVIIRSVIKIDV